MNHVEFYLWGDRYTVRFQYNRDYNGHPWQTLAWLAKWNPTVKAWLPVERVASNGYTWFDPGKAEVRKGTPIKDKGRKVALARALRNLGWCKFDRTVVWDAYLDFFYPLYKGDGLTDARFNHELQIPGVPAGVVLKEEVLVSRRYPDGVVEMDWSVVPF